MKKWGNVNKNRLIIALLFVLIAAPSVLLGAMSASKAATEAFKLWGFQSYTGTDHPWKQTNETKKIGFLSPGCQSEITIVGQGNNTWDAAFASLPADKGVLGTYSGIIMLRALVDLHNMTQVPTLQFVVDGVAVGVPVPAIQGNNESQWDSRIVPDGFHVVCSTLSTVDETSAKAILTTTQAYMVIVKQVP